MVPLNENSRVSKTFYFFITKESTTEESKFLSDNKE
jgi:hypothetical protein